MKPVREKRLLRKIIAFLIAVASIATETAARESPVRVGIYDAPPMVYMEDGKARGFGIDLIEYIAEKEGWSLEFVHETFSDCIDRLNEGTIDLVIPIVSDEEREKKYDFASEGLFFTFGRVYTQKGMRLKTLTELDGKSVGVIEDDIFNKEFRALARELNLECSYISKKTKVEVFDAIAKGHVDAGAMEGIAGFRHAQVFGVEPTSIIFTEVTSTVAAPKDHRPELILAIDRHMAALKQDKTSIFHKANRAWFGTATVERFPVWAVWLIGGLAVILALSSTFILVLRFQVNARTREIVVQNRKLQQEIDERKQAEQDRQLLQQQLQQSQKMEALGQLAGDVAHDLNNILMTISTHAGVIKKGISEGSSLEDSVSAVKEAVKQAKAVTRSLAIGSGGQMKMTAINLRKLIEASARFLNDTLPSRIQLVANVECEPCPWVLAEANYLNQLLLNIAINARDAMPEGGTLTLSLSWPDAPANGSDVKFVRLTIGDTGIGIADELQSRVFEPFFTTNARRGRSGLGLAVAHGIVHDHGGRIRVFSKEGEGSKFVIDLPTVSPPEIQDPLPGWRHASGKRILLAKDDERVRAVLAAYLTSLGYTVEQAGDLETVRRALEKAQPGFHLLILDRCLPGTSGLECLKEIRASGQQTPAIVMTDAPIGLSDGSMDVEFCALTRPFELSELGSMAFKVLETSRGKGGER